MADLTLRLPTDLDCRDGFNVPKGLQDVPVIIDPDLVPRGETRTNPYGPPKTIVLREWNEQVLLHEILHVLLARLPREQQGHEIINRIEVGLIAAGYVRGNPPQTLRDRHMRGEWLSDDELNVLAREEKSRSC